MSSTDKTSLETRAVVERMLEAINTGDQAGVHACMAPDIHFWMPGSTEIHGHFDGVEAFTQVSIGVFERLSEQIVLSVDNLIVGGEYAVAQAHGTAVTKKGEPYNNNYCLVWRVQGGVVTEMTEYHDTDLVRQVLLA